jgi:peroxiredoxin
MATVIESLARLRLIGKRPRLSIVVLLLVGGLAAAAAFAWLQMQATSAPGLLRPGSPAPEVNLPLLDGGTADLAKERGKVVVLNFWATWCVPCRSEMPALQHVADDLQSERFTLFEVDLQEDAATIEPFRQQLGLRMLILLDNDGEVTQRYGVRALPSTFLIDQQGVLRQQHLGPLIEGEGEDTPWSTAWLEHQVRALVVPS